MHNVTEHDSEQKWECDACKHCWISFFIQWYTISIYNLLINISKVGALVKGGSIQLVVSLACFDHKRDVGA